MTVAQGGFHMAHRVHHSLELGRVEAGFLVGAGQGFIQREVLFDHLRAQHGSGDVTLPAGGVVGQTHRQAELVEQFHHGGEVGVLVGGGVLGVAVQHRDLGAAAIVQDAQGVGDLIQVAHAGGKQHRGVQLGHFLEIRQVGDLSGGHFNKRQAQSAQKLHTGDVKRRRKVLDADGIAVFFQLLMPLEGEVQLADHLQLAFGRIGGLLLVLSLLGEFAHDQFRHSGLVLYNVRAALFGGQGQFFGHFQVAVVVDTGLGNDGYGHQGASFTAGFPACVSFFPVLPAGPYPSSCSH